MDHAFWEGRRVLVTGHTGFKGTWLTAWLEVLGAIVHGISLPPDEGDMYALTGLGDHDSTLLDLRDGDLRSVVTEFDPEIVLHLAAQSTVHTGYREPEATFATNVLGTVRLLDAIRAQPTPPLCTVVVTTDKVYGSEPRRFVESDRLAACDPYSGSKVGQEVVVASYRHSYFSQSSALVTARAGNVIGGGDNGPNRLLPDCVRALRAGEPVRLRHPRAIRPWQHVLEPLRGYLMYAAAGATDPAVPPSLNFGPAPSDSATVGDVAEDFLARLGAADRIELDRPDPTMVENPHLSIDPALAAPAIGWKPMVDRATALDWTASWYAAAMAGEDLRAVTLDQIATYQELTT